ncbi:DNA recombination protein RmuC [Blattabacterium cuenoti]|uniref:DNA recombination protein RmuC n=1 Tax=Blattabacterium cuenoti TaxID=1653831 RepID=UPI00163B87D5|nr:DNA recombination protein RmuC [Blattabacterium cuenoti]
MYFFKKLESFLKYEFKNQKNKNYELYKLNANSFKELKELWIPSLNNFRDSIGNEMKSYVDNNSKKLEIIYKEQRDFYILMEKRLECINESVNEKIQKSLNIHLEKSFEIIGNQLLFLQEGLGEMKILAKDVVSLKKTLNNVKICGNFSEMQLSMLLEQILSPDQYDTNVITKTNTNYVVEFAIKLPGIGDGNVWLPIDVKFPKETYEKLQKAYYESDKKLIELAKKNMESVLKKMSKDIKEKYIDPPYTTDFAILFLPFESIYAEVTKNSSLLEKLLINYNTVIAGPSTLAALLNSLQIGFRTLSIQKKTSEVWKTLEAVRQEFAKFGIMLHKAKDKLQGAAKDIDKLLGTQTNLIERKLNDIDKI